MEDKNYVQISVFPLSICTQLLSTITIQCFTTSGDAFFRQPRAYFQPFSQPSPSSECFPILFEKGGIRRIKGSYDKKKKKKPTKNVLSEHQRRVSVVFHRVNHFQMVGVVDWKWRACSLGERGESGWESGPNTASHYNLCQDPSILPSAPLNLVRAQLSFRVSVLPRRHLQINEKCHIWFHSSRTAALQLCHKLSLLFWSLAGPAPGRRG